MHKDTFFIDGVDAQSAGIRLQKPIEFEGIESIITSQSIPGRNGDLHFYTGAYKNRKGKASCFALSRPTSHSVQNTVDAATAFLLEKPGYRRLECSNDPDHFWLARVVNGARIENRMRMLNPFEIELDCKPQRFERSGEIPVQFSAPGNLENWFSGTALPIIKIYGDAPSTITVNDTVVEIKKINKILTIDSETQNAYNDIGDNANRDIHAPEFPELRPGGNNISFSGGVTKLEIIPRWWSK